MRPGNRPEHQDQRHQAAAGGDRVRQQGNGDIPSGEALAHDAGADHYGQQQGRTGELGPDAARDVHALASNIFTMKEEEEGHKPENCGVPRMPAGADSRAAS